MLQEAKNRFHFLASSIVWSLPVHAVFVLQACFALPGGGFIYSDWGWAELIFSPHAVLLYSLPPGYPFNDAVVDNWKIVGKIADAYPASLLYGAILALVYNWLRRQIQDAKSSGAKRLANKP
jgi:hypothetical protein